MNFFAPRTCTEVAAGSSKSFSLEELRDHSAYVLLGGPGAGKTKAFKHEAEEMKRLRVPALHVTARDFIAWKRSRLRNAVLFIDGLDEMRAGAADGRKPFDDIRAKLDRLDCPRFRLSCRTVDWFGENDSQNLKSVSPNGEVAVFQLDPLSDDAIRECLEYHLGNENVEEFQSHVRKRGIHFLLTNPQSLQMLADLAADGIWPETRTELFDKALRQLLREHNSEHSIPNSDDTQEDLVDAAGKLCAVQLLSDIDGYSRLGSDSPNCPGLNEVPCENRALLKRALGTRLFEKKHDCLTFVHARIAEFLAGRYLAKLIKDGLSIRRILALMANADGTVAVGLRGLVAWLAVHSKPSRLELIAREPLSIALDGDVRGFSLDNKTQLLEHMKQATSKHPWFRILKQDTSELGDLAMPEMEEQLRNYLENLSSSNSSDTSFAMVLLEVIRHGTAWQGLAAPVMKVIRNSQWEPAIREHALDVYLQLWRDSSATSPELLSLLQDIESKQVSDPRDELAGQLLEVLFPVKLTVAEVLGHLHRPKIPNYYARYAAFWNSGILKQLSPEQLVDLLDAFVEQYVRLRDEFTTEPGASSLFRKIPAKLLAHFLQTEHGRIELPKLFAWLGVAAWHGDWGYHPRNETDIVSWLERHPEEYKSLIRMSWEHCAEQPQCTNLAAFTQDLYMFTRRFFEAAPPENLGRWHLDQSIDATSQIIQEYLIQKAADSVFLLQDNKDFSAEAVQKRISHDAFLLEKFRARLHLLQASDDDYHSNVLPKVLRHAGSQTTQRWQKQYEEIKKTEPALRENRGAPGVLYFLARAYLGEFSDIPGSDPRARLRRLLMGDETLFEAALCGLQRSIERDDLPDAAEVIRTGSKGMIHTLTLPFLVGFKEADRLASYGDASLARDRLALAIHYTYPLDPNWKDQAWYKEIVEKHPQIVAEVLIQSTRSDLRSKKDCQGKLYALAFFPNHADVARLAALPLLRSFPSRAVANQLPSLRILLFAALLRSKKKPFLHLTARKLSLSSMTAMQRTSWLTAGFCAAPETYSKKFKSYIAESDLRIQQVIEFMAASPENLLARCKTEFLPCLIQLLGPSCKPWFYEIDHSGKGTRITPAMNAALRIDSWIKQLAGDPSQEITRELRQLASDDNLRSWKHLLEDAQYDQKELAKKTGFRYSNFEQVINTLRNDRPANAKDLTELTCDILAEIGRRIRDGSPAGWQQYWNLDSNCKLSEPRHENACRNTLLTHLQTRMERLEINAQPEGNYADDKRSDIRVSYGGFNVPVEIKKSSHRDLWTAIEKQLIKQYTRDPGADGYGIYLVFWLGPKECKLGPAGARPESAEDLQRQLRNTLTEEQSRKISIRVLDIEPPPAKTSTRQKKRSASRGSARRKSARQHQTKASKSPNR